MPEQGFTAPCPELWCKTSHLVDLYPPPSIVAREDGFAEEDLFVAIGEGGEGFGGAEVGGGDVVVEGLE